MTFTVTQGLFDIQVNGFFGVDFNDEYIGPEALDTALEAMLAHGVCHLLPTLITAPLPVLKARLLALDAAVQKSRLGALMIPGYHLEGPFLNPEDGYAGCHPKEAMGTPDAKALLKLEENCHRPILMVTLAPERDTDGKLITTLKAHGKCVAIGHAKTDYEVVLKAIQAGASASTHLGNGLPKMLPKFDNALFAQLGCDALFAGFIADGLHIPPFVLKTLLRAKGLEKSILVTDAVSAAGISRSGLYPFAGVLVQREEDGTVRTPGSTYLAGSSLVMDEAIGNLVRWQLASFESAIQMASLNPRTLLKESFEKHGISLPKSAVVWREKSRVKEAQLGKLTRVFE